MLQLKNETPFKVGFSVLPDRAGIDMVYVVVKATLTLTPRLALAPMQVPVTLADEYHDDPLISSIRLPSEMHIGKPGTDILLIGSAHAPEGSEVSQSMVSLSVAERARHALVSGDRFFANDGGISAPVPFSSMPLVWERAYGGTHQLPDRMLAEERNPIGIGFCGKRSKGEMAGQPVPNIEDPAQPLGSAGDVSSPMAFAPTSPAWLPRRAFAGTYDAAWQRGRSPYLPDDFDPRYLQLAAGEFAFDRYLAGGEPVRVEGARAEGPLEFLLPANPLTLGVRIAGVMHRPPLQLQTVLIAPDANLLCLSWHAAQPCDRKVLAVERIEVAMAPRVAAREEVAA